MKKILAVLLTLALALSCTLAMAETTEAAPAPAFQGMTIESQYDVNRDALKNLLTQMGLDEATLVIVDSIASIIDQSGERLVIASDGLQAELLLKDTSLVNLVALLNEKGLTLGSNLIPNYALNISVEEIGKYVMEAFQKANEAQSVDMFALQQAVMPHLNDFINTCTASVTSGDLEQGDYVMDGVSYNVKVPMNIDLVAIVEAANKLVEDLRGDENVMAALEQLRNLGVDINLDESTEPIDTANLPTVNIEFYTNLNDKGEQSDPSQVTVNVIPVGQTDPATVVYVTTNGASITVDAQFISDDYNTELIYAMDRDPADPLAVSCRLDAYVNGFYTGFAAVTSTDEQGIPFDAYLYVMDTENAIAEEHGSITMSGELTLGVSDSATVLTLADLTGEDANGVVGGMSLNLLMNGMGVLSTAAGLMPDEIGAITSLFMGDDSATEPAA